MSAAENKAVFLSYASQDAEAAKRIADALRAAGVEVWFDAEGGLEHGDEWDQKIRRQIKECVLFIPIISACTQAREEGYFRLEWDLAAERARTIASGVAFILPVVIDDTREPDALVPDRFRTVQWTNLPGGIVPPEVLQRFLKLWSHRTGALKHQTREPENVGGALRPDGSEESGYKIRPTKTKGRGLWIAGGVLALILAGVLGQRYLQRDRGPAAVPPAVASAQAEAKPAGAAATPRGIAVLPFENMGTADQAYFAAGVTEEVTQYLAKIKGLRVMSRQAVARFKGGAAELPAMTSELGIGALLTGSVRHAGNQVRIGVQLLAAPSGEILWSYQYDGEARDIFGVQTDVAVRVARALQATLAPEERARIERQPTGNLAAYELYLKAGSKPHPEAVEMLKQAIALDPGFALAHATLSRRILFMSFTTGREDANRALEAARTAVALDPQLPRAHHALGNALGRLGQVDEARLALLRAIELDASFHAALNDLSVLEANTGRLDQAFYWAKRAFPLAPNLAYSYYHVAAPLLGLDDAAAERWLRAGLARFPADDRTGVFRLEIWLAFIELYQGQPAAALERMRRVVAAWPTNGECQVVLTEMAFLLGADDARERVEQALQAGPDARMPLSSCTPRTLRAVLWLRAGDRGQAQPLIDAAFAANRAARESGDRNYTVPYEDAVLHLLQGDRAAALAALESAAAAGFIDAAFLQVDPLLAPLAPEPRFRQVVDRINRHLREMRSRVDLSDLDELAGIGRR